MFVRQLKKILNLNKSDSKSPINRIEKGFNFASRKFFRALLESKVIIEKLKDLHKTNYKLGLRHLRKGNLREAIFRFKIVRKFWPHDLDAHLNLIYCYFITQEEERSSRAIEYLLYLEPSFKPEIEELRINASFYVNPKEVKSETKSDDKSEN